MSVAAVRPAALAESNDSRLDSRYVFITYDACSLDSIEVFEECISNFLSSADQYYGSRELPKERAKPSYHVLVGFKTRVNISLEEARDFFAVTPPSLGESMSFSVPPRRRSVQNWIGDAVAFIESHGPTEDRFAQPFDLNPWTRSQIATPMLNAGSLMEGLEFGFCEDPEWILSHFSEIEKGLKVWLQQGELFNSHFGNMLS